MNISSNQFHVLNGRNVDIHSDKGIATVDCAIENGSILVVSPSVLLRRMAVKVLVSLCSYFTLFDHRSSSLVWELDFQLQPPYIVLRFSEPCSRVLKRARRKLNMKGCSNTVFIVKLSSKISFNLKRDLESSVQK